MKNLHWIPVFILIVSISFIVSCKKSGQDATSLTGPTLHLMTIQGYISTDMSVEVNSSLLFGISGIAGDGNLSRFIVQRVFNGITTTEKDSVFNSIHIVYEVHSSSQTTVGLETWIFKMYDVNGNVSESSIKITTIPAPVNGTVSFASGLSGNLSYAKVSLYTGILEWQNNIPVKYTTVVGSGNSVTFSMSGVIPGTYFMDVWKDNNADGNWSTGDFIGWLGTGNLGTISLVPFQLSAGGTFTANITMYIF